SDELLSEAGINKNDALAMVNYAQGENERALSAASGDTAYKTAMTMLQGGIMPSAALLSAAGISRQDAESIVSAVTAAARTTDPNAYKTAMTMLQSGRMPSDELLAEAGISRQDALSLASVGQTAVKQSSAGTAKTSYNKTQAEAALAAALNGDMSGPVRQIVEGWYGLPLETVIAGSAPQVKYTQAQAETALTAALGGNMSEPVRQIVEGWYGLPLETVLSIYSGDTSAGGGSEPYSAAAPVNTSSAYTPTPPEESLDYDADSGIFRWNGGIYTDIKNLIEAMEDARLSEKTEQVLEKKFASLGWPQTKIK
ncbi:MAG: hypothetical protein ILP09_00465, partial [Oscillospiraceae bacterium]|nr:hypothetical protein [Oscillospiraceae bacterium]